MKIIKLIWGDVDYKEATYKTNLLHSLYFK